MTKANATMNDWSEGEISYKMRGRNDIPVFKSVAEWQQNFITLPQGPLMFRPGTQYVFHTRLNQPAYLYPFYDNDIQSYLLEFTDSWLRFYNSQGIITLPATTISNITQASPAVVTDTAHGYSNGDEVIIYNTVGMNQIDGQSFIVTGATTDTYELYDTFGNPSNTIGYNAYVSGGEAFKVYEIATPYVLADLPFLNMSQATTTAYVVNRNYEPRQLTIVTETDWTLSTFTRTSDPFGANNWPGAVAFTSDSRLIYGGTNTSPNTLWGSAGPDSNGDTRYDDFTHPSNPTSIDAYTYTLASVKGQSDSIRWIANTDQFLVIGTFGTCRYGYGNAIDQPITPLAVNFRCVNSYGSAFIPPVSIGSQLFYVQRSANVMRTIEYDYLINGYESNDKNLVADHILNSGVVTICNQTGIPEIVWGCRNDGVLVGMSYNLKENKYGWHRHYVSGAKTTWVQKLPQENNQDMLWMVNKRTDDVGRTVYHVEYMAPYIAWPEPLQFYTGAGNAASDNINYSNVLYEQQKNSVFLDASIQYDGSSEGFINNITMTPGTGATHPGATNVGFTASASFFTASMVGRQIWGAYGSDGSGGGRAVITSVASDTVALVTILDNGYPNENPMVPGAWFITASTFYGLAHLEGQTVTVCNDGALYGTVVVTNASITISKQASKVTVGLPYIGILKTPGLDLSSKTGPGMTKLKSLVELRFKLYNTCGIAVGTDPYSLKEIQFRQTGQITGRPIPLFTGIIRVPYQQDSSQEDKHIYVVQNNPFACYINSMDPYVDTTES